MSKNKKIDKFFELLCLNDSKELRKFLIENGKAPKVISPIMFEKPDNIKGDDSKNGKYT